MCEIQQQERLRSNPVRVLCVFILASATWLSNASANAAVPVQTSDCTVELAASQESFAIIKEDGEISKAQAPLLQQQLVLLANLPKGSDKPLIDTMSKADLVKFTEIRSKLVFTSIQSYLNSERERDIVSIKNLWNIAMNDASGKSSESDKVENGIILQEVIHALTDKLADQSVKLTIPSSSTSCDIPMALSIAESTFIQMKSQNSKLVSSAIAWIDGVITKHPQMGGKVNLGVLTANERTYYNKIVKKVIKPEIAREQAVKQAEFLKIMYFLSAERTTDGQADLVRSGGDGDAVGKTFKAKPRDPMSRLLLGALYYVGDKIPSQNTIMNQGIGSTLPKDQTQR